MPRLLRTLVHISFWAGLAHAASAQFTDGFSDGDLTNAPAWSGDNGLFTVVDDNGDQRLRSNSPGAANYALSTASTLASDARWEWYMDLRFATSGANYVDVYLIADNAAIAAVQNGWFVRVGGTQDRVELFKRVSGVNTSVIASPDGIVNSSSSNPFRIRAERSTANDWTLLYDDGATGSFAGAGTANDGAVPTGTHFGLLVVQSTAASAVNNHFFDDFSVGTIPVDLSPPALLSATAVSATEVDLLFNEAIDPGTATNVSNYALSGGLAVQSTAVLGADGVRLTSTTAFISGTLYTITVNGVEDLAGNACVNALADFSFFIPEVPAFRDVVINEIMADPAPPVGLPDVEFVELYNATTDKTFDLADWTFSDGGTPVAMPSYALLPGAYVLVTAASNLGLFPAITNKLGLPSLPALNNEGDALDLRDNSGVQVDAVTYGVTWYQDNIKADGGWTLEQIDPTAPCSGASNWKASNAAAGGTPSVQNSVFAIVPDVSAPALGSVVVNGPTTIGLLFTESMDASSLSSATYDIAPFVEVAGVAVTAPNGVALTLGTPLEVGTLYTIVVEGVSDCAGNSIGSANTLSFALPEPVEVGDVVINEVLYDPIGSGSDFVELYNRSDKTLSLAGWRMANETDGVIANATPIHSALLLLPGEYVLLTENAQNTGATYPRTRSDRFVETDLPSYNNDEGTVVLLAPDGSTLDLFRYSDDLHFTLVNNPEGYSLERVDPERPSSDATNWQTASDLAGRATPGYLNSQYASAPEPTGSLTIDPAIFSPDNDGYQDVLTIVYRFDQPGFVGNLSIFDATGREMRKLMENLLLGTEGAIAWDGLMEGGGKARVGAYIVLLEVYDLAGNVETYKKTITLAHPLGR